MAVLKFLESYDFSGKTVVPFCTHGGGGSGGSFQSVESAASGATVLNGLSVSGASAGDANSRVVEWLNGLKLN